MHARQLASPALQPGGHGATLDAADLARAGPAPTLVLYGHDHDYERFAPVDGVRQFVIGTGGRNQTAFRKNPDPGSQVRMRQFGILDLELAPTSYTWRFRAVPTGAVLDSGTSDCR